nr:amidase [Luteolibacter marinus]
MPLRAIIQLDPGDLMRQARESALRWRSGSPLSVMDGVPVAVKDELDQVPYPTRAGTTFLGESIATRDATAVARLRAAGALLIGKANMHEIGIGVTGHNPHHGAARNPHDPSRHTGGSSSGSAAAVAAGLCPVALGADGGGSIRIPAAFCGVVGLKPTFGRVSEQGAFPLCWSLAHIGPIASTARDAAITYALIAGQDPAAPGTRGQPPVSIDGIDRCDLKGVRLGVFDPWFRDASPEVSECCSRMLERFQEAGAEIVPVVIDDLEFIRVAHLVSIVSEMAQSMSRYHKDHGKDFSHDTRMNLALARHLTSSDYIQAQRVRTRAMAIFRRAFENVDAILTPTTGCTAPRIQSDAMRGGESDLALLSEIMRFVVAGNLTGLPAISFPAGHDPAGLPVGMQAIGRWWDEPVLLRIAAVAEHFAERRKPAIHYSLLD